VSKLSYNLTFFYLRMLQTLEREPQESFQGLSSGGHPLGLGGVPHGGPHGKVEPPVLKTRTNFITFEDASPAASRMPSYVPGSKGYIENGDSRRGMRDNPHKYLLYKPSLSQLMVFLSSGFKELPPGGALLLYISADGCFSTTKHPQDCKLHFVISFDCSKINFISFKMVTSWVD
jgi:Protein SCAI